MESEKKQTVAPPYISYKTFRTFMENTKKHNVPKQVDRSILGNFSGSVGTQLLGALRFLGLVSEGDLTTPKMEQLKEAFGGEKWPGALAAVLRDAYKPIVAIDPKTATPAMLEKAFKDSYTTADAVREKCVTFFLHAAKDASLGLSSHLLSKTRKAPKRKPKVAAAAPASQPAMVQPTPPPAPASPSAPTVSKTAAQIIYEILDPTAMNKEEQAAVFTLLTYLRKSELGNLKGDRA